MFSSATIEKIQRELQALNSSALVLLGGSYLYGEATEESDVDFYAVLGVKSLLAYFWYRRKILALKDRHFTVDFRVMIVPRFIFKRGWYYIYGRDLRGKIHSPTINESLILRNSLKLAFFHYVHFLTLRDSRERRASLIKATQQLVPLIVMHDELYTFRPLFSLAQTRKKMARSSHFAARLALEILSWKNSAIDITSANLDYYGAELGRRLKRIYDLNVPYFSAFSLANYLIYNFRFLLKAEARFLLGNPDQLIFQKIRRGLFSSQNSITLYHELKQIIFPVIII